MKKFIVWLTVLVVVAFGTVGFSATTAAPAFADDGRPCVTHDEYRDVEDGWSKERVNNKFDSNGTLVGTTSQGGEVIKKDFDWNACWNNDIAVQVTFRVECCSLRVVAKRTYCTQLGGC